MNYVILNGKKSTEITGLLIQSLPPISKPLMRTEIEEIDGRDGDIVTKLGYSAYDKEVTIGLYGDYDIDAVISYFNSEGTVTFSNEITKYYNYEIIEQIDFERLIRFRTATVTFHVQPFKYSTIEESKALVFDNQLLTIDDFTKTTSGVTVASTSGVISVTGTSTSAVEVYMPVNAVTLKSGSYSLNAYATGTSPQSCSIRLIDSSPSQSFGGAYVTLKNNDTVTINATISGTKTYNYLYFYIPSGATMDFTLSVILQSGNQVFTIKNNGNITAKPILTIYGMDDITISLNGQDIFGIELGDEEYITIDTAGMEAYKDGTLKNRLVTGDYDDFALRVGSNTIGWTGTVTQIVIRQYSRWL